MDAAIEAFPRIARLLGDHGSGGHVQPLVLELMGLVAPG